MLRPPSSLIRPQVDSERCSAGTQFNLHFREASFHQNYIQKVCLLELVLWGAVAVRAVSIHDHPRGLDSLTPDEALARIRAFRVRNLVETSFRYRERLRGCLAPSRLVVGYRDRRLLRRDVSGFPAMWHNKSFNVLQKTYDDSYMSCSTAVYYESQVFPPILTPRVGSWHLTSN